MTHDNLIEKRRRRKQTTRAEIQEELLKSTKVCRKCAKEKKKDEFHKRSKTYDGLYAYCKACAIEEQMRRWPEYARINKESRKEYLIRYRAENAAKIADKRRENAGVLAEKGKEYRTRVRDRLRKSKNQYEINRRSRDLSHRILCNLRSRLISAAKGVDTDKTRDIVGCSIDELKSYLEGKFTDGMSWDNYGVRGWHIDHIKPCSKFDLSKRENQLACFHYSNLQPLWAFENITKGAKYAEDKHNCGL